MKILVTGGAGYIGSVTTEMLVMSGHAVTVFDNLSQGHRAAVHPDAEFVQGDICDPDAVNAVFEKRSFEAVVHFASRTLVGESMQRPLLYLGENVIHGIHLFECMIRHRVDRFLFSSTANLFDEPQEIPITEQEQIVPGSPYGESKFILERILHWLDRTCDLRFASLRYFNAAGASERCGEQHDPETHLIPLVLEVAQGKRDKIMVFGDDYPTSDGTCVRDYVHITDLAQAHILALEALGEGSCTYHLGNGQGFSVQEVIETAREITGHPIPAEIAPRRPGDPPILVASSEKIRTELGWNPQYPHLKDIVASAWHWHQTHPTGYARL